MIHLLDILNEAVLTKMYKAQVVLVTDRNVNKTDTINELRGVEDVVYIKVRQNQSVIDRGDDEKEYTLLQVKYMASEDDPAQALEHIKQIAMKGSDSQDKVLGIKTIFILHKTIEPA